MEAREGRVGGRPLVDGITFQSEETDAFDPKGSDTVG